MTICRPRNTRKVPWSPKNGWFILENSIKMDDLGVPLFLETSIYIDIYIYIITHNTYIYIHIHIYIYTHIICGLQDLIMVIS